EEAFPCFRLAKQAAQTGGTACAVLNGANETAVAHYLRGECGFYDIPRMVDHALQTVPFAVADTLETVLQADRAARAAADSWMR
ncbi:MAG: 1-deoxy-D-xylulose-5-phosphate reductoisomerase, partial [Oscillospiraceae bacterium]